MAAGGGIHIHIFDTLRAEFVFDHLAHLMGDVRGVGMADTDPVLMDIVAQLRHHIHQMGHGLEPAGLRSHGNHFPFLAHVDDGTHADQGSHGGGQPAYTAAAAEELEVVGKEVHGKMIHFFLGPLQDLVQGFSGLHKVSHLPRDVVADGGNAFGVDFLETGSGIFLLQLCDGLVHDVEGVGHGPGEVYVEDVVAFLEVFFEVADIPLFGNGAGGGQNACTQCVVESVGVECLEIFVGIDRFCVDAVGHRDQRVTVFSRNGGRDVGVGVCKDAKHGD